MDFDIFQLAGIVRRRILHVVLGVVAGVVLAAGLLLFDTPLYRSTAEIHVDGPAGKSDGELYLLQSREVLGDVAERLDLLRDPYLAGAGLEGDGALDGVIEEIRGHLRLERRGESPVLAVTMAHRDGEAAARIANAIGESYLRLKSLDTATALGERSETLRRRALDAHAAVETFRAENDLALADPQRAVLDEQLGAARGEAERLKAAHDEALALRRADVEAGAIPEALRESALSALHERYSLALARQAELSANLGDGHPQMRAARSQLSGARAAIDSELARIRALTAANAERARAELAAVEKRLAAQAGDDGDEATRRRLDALVGEAEALDAAYAAALAGDARQDDGGNPYMLAAAVPAAEPERIPAVPVFLMAILAGAAFGAVLALLRDWAGDGEEPHAVDSSDAEEKDERSGCVVPLIRRPEATLSPPSRGVLPFAAAFATGRPATIAVLSVGAPGRGRAAHAIARELQALGEAVLFADGTLRRSVRIPTGSVAAKRSRSLDEMLLFYRLGADHHRSPADFAVIDCYGTPAQALLPTILSAVDGILVVSADGTAAGTIPRALAAQIAPWREKLIGSVLAGARAA